MQIVELVGWFTFQSEKKQPLFLCVGQELLALAGQIQLVPPVVVNVNAIVNK